MTPDTMFPDDAKRVALRAMLVERVEARGRRRRRRHALALVTGAALFLAAGAQLLDFDRGSSEKNKANATPLAIEHVDTRPRPWIREIRASRVHITRVAQTRAPSSERMIQAMPNAELGSWLRAADTNAARVIVGDRTIVLALENESTEED